MQEFSALVSNRRIQSIALDGLDGSGKGSCVEILAELFSEYGHNVVIIELPCYTTPWGKVLTHLLKEYDENLSLQERMTVYALNRLETLDAIKTTSQTLFEQNQLPITLLFDRFVTSNALTIAYYVSSKKTLTLEQLDPMLPHIYSQIWEIDSHYVRELHLSDTKVYVPIIHPNHSLHSLRSDTSRSGADSYETLDVQTLAHHLYTQLPVLDPKRFVIFDQIDSSTGNRLNKTQIARFIFSRQPTVTSAPSNSMKGQITTLQITDLTVPSKEMHTLLNNREHQQLKRINPYV